MNETERSEGWKGSISPMELRLYGLIIAAVLGANPMVNALRTEEPRTITLQLDGIRDSLGELKDAVKEGNRQFIMINQRVNEVEGRVSLLEERTKRPG